MAATLAVKDLDGMLQDLHSDYASASQYSYGDYSDYFFPSDLNGGDQFAPRRPPPPKDNLYSEDTLQSNRSRSGSTLPHVRKPPKLQHVLVNKRHDLSKATPRDDGLLDYHDDGDYGQGKKPKKKFLEPPKNVLPDVSDEELEEIDAGETPRGEKSMVINTDYGELKSKYRYAGFGIWENTEPADPPPPPRKPSPPPPPPKAEPIWYNCTVAVETIKTSKELDDLTHNPDGYSNFPKVNVEIGETDSNNLDIFNDGIWRRFEKEDMSDMFKRAMLEKMAMIDNNTKHYTCVVCRERIIGRTITAMGQKFHPECFVCTYCKKEFKERLFKSDEERRPYCYRCFEKLLGHYGTAHDI